ncbi:MAG: zinc-ribbon protein [Siphoviridae sp. cttb18]|nr:MAG: zinc-ribbon protein [Siphoviridae sp. cttb18]
MNQEQLKKLLDPRQPVYKRVKMLMPHCPVCKEQLSGNNSMVSPYRCSCGEWESDWFNGKVGNFKIKTNPQ